MPVGRPIDVGGGAHGINRLLKSANRMGRWPENRQIFRLRAPCGLAGAFALALRWPWLRLHDRPLWNRGL
jgi:hypothetical protein